MKRIILLLFIIISFQNLYADEFILQKINEPYKSDLYKELRRGEDRIYSLGPRALRMLNIDGEGHLQLIDELPLYGHLIGLEINQNYAYSHVGPPYTETILYRINTENNNLILVDSLHFPPPAHYIKIYKSYNNIFAQISYNSYTILNIYNNDTFELLTQYNLDEEFPDVYAFSNINDSYVYGRDRNNTRIWHIYDIGNIYNIHQIAEIDLTNEDVEMEYKKLLNDSIYVFQGFNKITFFDISDITDWRIASQIVFDQSNHGGADFAILENDRIVIPRQLTFDLYDISEITNPRLINSFYYDFFCAPMSWIGYESLFYNANFYLGIEEFKVADNMIERIGRYPMFASIFKAFKHNDFLIVKTFYDERNLHFFDVSDIYNPQYICTYFNEYNIYGIDFYDNKMAVSKKEWENPANKSIDVYDITDIENPLLINCIEGSSGPIIHFANIDTLFTIEYYSDQYHFIKYDISETGTHDTLFDFTLTGSLWGFDIYGNYAYFVNEDNIYVIENINTNTPEVINILNINNYATLRIEDEYLLLFNYGQYNNWIEFYNLTDPVNPVCEYIIYPEFSEGIAVHNDLVFIGYNNIDVYDLNNCSYFIEDPIFSFHTTFGLQSMSFFEEDNNKYFYYRGQAAVALFEYEYNNAAVDDEPEPNSTMLTSYPNPFTTSTTISFAGKINSHESSQIKIYNVKGQLVREFKIQNLKLKINEVVWDGKDENGKEVGAGVYLYKLNSNDEHIGKVVKIR